MSNTAQDIAEGRAAWQRLRNRARASWDDWKLVGRALTAGRNEVMAAAGVNSPFGKSYTRKMAAWLAETGFDSVGQQVRSRLMLCLDHLDEIEHWRTTLTDEQRTRWAHPDSVWMHYSRSLQPARNDVSSPHLAPHFVQHKHHKPAEAGRRGGGAVYWDGESIRRAAAAIHETYASGDCYLIARRALEAAVRDEADLLELLRPNTAMSALPRRADVVGAAGYGR